MWRWAKGILKLDEEDKVTFCSSSDVWCLSVPSSTKPKERELDVDSGESIHMLGRLDLISAERATVRVSRDSTTVLTANGEVQTNEEGTVYVNDQDLFVTVLILEDTPPVLPL